jgi:16S rRNA (guanine527-N7)-methyltransferase
MGVMSHRAVEALVRENVPASYLHTIPNAEFRLSRILQSDFHAMDAAHIAELLKPFLRPTSTTTPCHSEPSQRRGEEPAVLSLAQLQSISTYIDILRRWNARINLTAIRSPEDIVTRHFGESLFAARHLFPLSPAPSPVSSVVKDVDADVAVDADVDVDVDVAGSTSGRAALKGRVTAPKEKGASAPVSLADIGSGAGFPGLPIKLWAPHLSLTLIESNHKKAAFLREVTRALTLTDVNIQNARAETSAGTYDAVTLRAVERFESILPTAAALVRPSGRLALLISSAQQPQARSTLPDFAWSEPSPIPQSRSRILLIARRES